MPPREARRAALWMDDAATREADADAPPVALFAMNHCALGVSDLDNMAKYAATIPRAHCCRHMLHCLCCCCWWRENRIRTHSEACSGGGSAYMGLACRPAPC